MSGYLEEGEENIDVCEWVGTLRGAFLYHNLSFQG